MDVFIKTDKFLSSEPGAGPHRRAAVQATSEHHLPPWGMKPTVLDRRNLLDLHTLTRTH
jgi:hypothetical protein